MKEINMESRPVHYKEVAYQKLLDEIVLLNLDSGIYYSTNEIGAKIWQLCDGNTDLKGITDKICEEYEVAEVEAEKDVLFYVEDLINEGLMFIKDE